jgi:hypothetical protein
MSGDNTQVNTGSGDFVRDIDRSVNPVPIAAKTQIVQIDAGGQSEEQLVSCDNPLPIYDQYRPVRDRLALQSLLLQQTGGNGFVPIEITTFLVGG